jgi:hypothetical protein
MKVRSPRSRQEAIAIAKDLGVKPEEVMEMERGLPAATVPLDPQPDEEARS